MKLKRFLFIAVLIALFAGCLYKMNQQYDKLARYPYALTEEERTLVLEHLNTEGINYIVSQQIKPEQFIPFIGCEGFEITNTLWYDVAIHSQEGEAAYIVSFINKYKTHLSYTTLNDILQNYTYNVLTRFFDEGDGYAAVNTLHITTNPKRRLLVLKNNATLYNYEPKTLALINDLPHTSMTENNDITLQEEAVEPLRELLEAAKEINAKEYGDMHIIAGYISFEEQALLYQKAIEKYGDKNALLYWKTPGCNEEQLGFSVMLAINGEHNEETSSQEASDETHNTQEEKEQAIWLKDNAYKYGFTLRYPKGKEEITGKAYQPFTLRFVGKDLAKYLHDNNLAMEEIDISDFEE